MTNSAPNKSRAASDASRANEVACLGSEDSTGGDYQRTLIPSINHGANEMVHPVCDPRCQAELLPVQKLYLKDQGFDVSSGE